MSLRKRKELVLSPEKEKLKPNYIRFNKASTKFKIGNKTASSLKKFLRRTSEDNLNMSTGATTHKPKFFRLTKRNKSVNISQKSNVSNSASNFIENQSLFSTFQREIRTTSDKISKDVYNMKHLLHTSNNNFYSRPNLKLKFKVFKKHPEKKLPNQTDPKVKTTVDVQSEQHEKESKITSELSEERFNLSREHFRSSQLLVKIPKIHNLTEKEIFPSQGQPHRKLSELISPMTLESAKKIFGLPFSKTQSSSLGAGRKKKSKIEFNKNWYKEQGIPYINIAKNLTSAMEYQNNTIKDQLKILGDNFLLLKKSYFSDPILRGIVNHLDHSSLVKMNLLIEESIFLIDKILQLILSDYYDDMDMYISIIPPDLGIFKKRLIKNEIEEFSVNIKYLSKMQLFLQGCTEVFDIVSKKSDSPLMTSKSFLLAVHFLERCRLNISNIYFSISNYAKNYKEDHLLIADYYKSKSSKFGMHFRSQSTKKENVYSQIYDRIKKLHILFEDEEYDKEKESKKKEVRLHLNQNFSLNSPLINRIFKYCSKEFREQVIKERIRSRYHKEEPVQTGIPVFNI